jgi:hypothetical protein
MLVENEIIPYPRNKQVEDGCEVCTLAKHSRLAVPLEWVSD